MIRLIYRRRIIWFVKGILNKYYWCEFEHYWYMKKFKDEKMFTKIKLQ